MILFKLKTALISFSLFIFSSRLQPERRDNRSLHNRTKHVSLEEERATSQTGSNTGQTSLDTRHLVSSDSSSFEDTLTSEERETVRYVQTTPHYC